jgi:hypothetical protein
MLDLQVNVINLKIRNYSSNFASSCHCHPMLEGEKSCSPGWRQDFSLTVEMTGVRKMSTSGMLQNVVNSYKDSMVNPSGSHAAHGNQMD